MNSHNILFWKGNNSIRYTNDWLRGPNENIRCINVTILNVLILFLFSKAL